MGAYVWTAMALVVLGCSGAEKQTDQAAGGSAGAPVSGAGSAAMPGGSGGGAGEITMIGGQLGGGTAGAAAAGMAGNGGEATGGGGMPNGGAGGAPLEGGTGGVAGTGGSAGAGAGAGGSEPKGPDACDPPVVGNSCGNACGKTSDACVCDEKPMGGGPGRDLSMVYPATGVPDFCPAPSGGFSDVYNFKFAYNPDVTYCGKVSSPFAGAGFRLGPLGSTTDACVTFQSAGDAAGSQTVFVKVAGASWVRTQTASFAPGESCPLSCP